MQGKGYRGVVMGLFSDLKKQRNIELSLQISNYYSGGVTNPNYEFKVRRFIKTHNNSKKDSLLAAISLCGEPTTPKQLYVVSRCFVLAGASYRVQAIEFLHKYIDAGAIWEGTPRSNVTIDGYTINQLDINKASVYCDLGKAYEGEYQFDNALLSYSNSLKCDPSYTPAISYSADIYVKKNLIDSGLNFLKNFRNSPFKDVRLIASEKTKELIDKKLKGYVYRPRKRKKDTTVSQP